MSDPSPSAQTSAIQEFRTARFQANMEIIRGYLTGRSADLLSYEDVRKKVRALETNKRELREIPIDAIVGSVGRHKDFTRHFLPRIENDQQRWARVHSLAEGLEGLPPIEVYQIGEVYFVSDGNHRVSVARSQNSTQIEALVTLVETNVPLEPDIQPDDLIIKERYAHFLQRTRLKETYPDLDLSMSEAGNYHVLEEQIAVHQWWVKEHKGEEIDYPAAAARWYRYIYWPVIQMIRERGMMRDFPERTETDLYVWIAKHRQDLAEELGWSVDAQTAVADLAITQNLRPPQLLKRIGKKINKSITPPALESGPPPGIWRESFLAGNQEDCLFQRILVAVNGREEGWAALEQALQVARQEQGRIFGLHVLKPNKKQKNKETEGVKEEFYRRCAAAGVQGEFNVESGKAAAIIADRARWVDLVVVSLAHPPGIKTAQRLNSQFRRLLRRCPRPVLTVPQFLPDCEKLLLAYDGSPKAREALFITAYLAGQWQLPVKVVTVLFKMATPESADYAHTYLLDRQITVEAIQESGDPAQIILEAAAKEPHSLLIMGSYGKSPLLEAIRDSVIGQVLRRHNEPILICR